MRRFINGLAALSLMLGWVGRANAGMLLDLEDPAEQANTPETLTFIAGTTSTILEFAGYNIVSRIEVSQIDLTQTGGSTNLLGPTWAFTAAPSGSSGDLQFNDGTAVNGVKFEGSVEDSFDIYSQTISTVVGDSYTLSFLVTNTKYQGGTPSELVVSGSDATVVPEPSSLIMLSLAAGVFGVWRIRKVRRASGSRLAIPADPEAARQLSLWAAG